MDTLVEAIPYRGYDIQIHRDDHPDSPDDWGDDNLFVLSFLSRDLWVARGLQTLKFPRFCGHPLS